MQEPAAQNAVGEQIVRDLLPNEHPADYLLQPDPTTNANLMHLTTLRLPFQVLTDGAPYCHPDRYSIFRCPLPYCACPYCARTYAGRSMRSTAPAPYIASAAGASALNVSVALAMNGADKQRPIRTRRKLFEVSQCSRLKYGTAW